jgi:methionyl-tRNA formyltransferase
MRIFIITMDDPVQTIPFIRAIIDKRKNDITGVATAKGDRMRIGKNRSKLTYLFTLLLIMGPVYFISNAMKSVWFKIRKKLSGFLPLISSPSILTYARALGIKTYHTHSPNSQEFLNILREHRPDVIINQSQSILKKELLSIPAIGVINRHNALLPKNRGRLTPFWVLLRKEKETGVSIHLVNEGIDAGPVIVQEKFEVAQNETFKSLVEKNYQVAPIAMLKALDFLESGKRDFLPNDDTLATYNPVPAFGDALKYLMRN